MLMVLPGLVSRGGGEKWVSRTSVVNWHMGAGNAGGGVVPLLRSEPGRWQRQVASFPEHVIAHLEFSHGMTNLILLPDIVDKCCDFLFIY